MVYNRKTIHSQRLFDTQLMSGSILYIAIICCTLSLFFYHFFLLLIQETSFETPQFYEKKIGDPQIIFFEVQGPKRSPSPLPAINNGRSLKKAKISHCQ